jgi:peptide-methionine (S)-S-oxide reductase
MPVPERHEVLETPLRPPFPAGVELAVFGMGCFWGAERIFWQTPGVYTTAVGYTGGYTPNPTYEEVCSGRTGHAEAVLVAYRSEDASGAVRREPVTSYADLLARFWEGHDPTQGMRQGNDVGTQYRSLVVWQDDSQRAHAEASLREYQKRLRAAGYGEITTQLLNGHSPTATFYYAEPYHQQYLAKNPGGYCGLGATGVSCPVSLVAAS